VLTGDELAAIIMVFTCGVSDPADAAKKLSVTEEEFARILTSAMKKVRTAFRPRNPKQIPAGSASPPAAIPTHQEVHP
jgi:predicted DNA-binding protein (UPF0251 family)